MVKTFICNLFVIGGEGTQIIIILSGFSDAAGDSILSYDFVKHRVIFGYFLLHKN